MVNEARYAAMRKHVAEYRDRTWAVEGTNGAGRPFASLVPIATISQPGCGPAPGRATGARIVHQR